MGALVRVPGRGDRDAGRVVVLGLRRAHAEDRLGIRAGQISEALGQLRQGGRAQLVQQLLRVVGAGARRRPGPRCRCGPGVRTICRCARCRSRTPAGQRPDAGHGRHRVDLGAVALGEGEIVLHERVLRVVPAPGHASAALDAAGALRPGSAEVRVGHGLARLGFPVPAEEDADRGHVERVALAELLGQPFHLQVAGRDGLVDDDAEHLLGLGVMRREFVAPVGDVRPLRVVVERLQRLVQGVRVVQRATAHARTGEDQAVLEQVDALDAGHAELRRPDEIAQPPGRLGQCVVGEPSAGFEDADLVTLLRQPQRGDAAAEPGPDHHDVVVGHSARHQPFGTAGHASGTDPAIDYESIEFIPKRATTPNVDFRPYGRARTPRHDQWNWCGCSPVTMKMV